MALAPKALGRGLIGGDRLVRFVYLDEAGISNAAQEPFVVVAGPLVHADGQWKALDAELRAIAEEELPAEMRENSEFVFHTTELFSGGKKFPRDQWSRERRWSILDRLVSVPQRHNIPVAWGFAERERLAAYDPEQYEGIPRDPAALSHAIAFVICAISVERWLRENTKDEVATIVAEDNPQIRQHLKGAQLWAQRTKNFGAMSIFANAGYLPFERIVDTVHFARKSESALLQLADVCAFFIKRALMKKPEAERFIAPIRKQMFHSLNREDFVKSSPAAAFAAGPEQSS
jgi:uncharacterized protein DUF3800